MTNIPPPVLISSPPSRSRFLRARGLRHHLRCWGDPGQPWLWLGTGWLDCSASFGPMVAGLLPDWYVVSPDWRGLGHSEWPADGYWFPDYLADVDALLDQLAPPGPIDFVGHSMGAQVLSLYAGLRPERVRRLALLDGLMLPDRPPEQALPKYRRWLEQLRRVRPSRHYASIEDLAGRVRKQHPQLSEAWARFVAESWSTGDGHGGRRLLADPRHHLNMPIVQRLAENEVIWGAVSAPVLFIDGGRSLFLQGMAAGQQERRYAVFSDAQVVHIPEAGHMLHWDAPEATAAHLRAFFSAPREPAHVPITGESTA